MGLLLVAVVFGLRVEELVSATELEGRILDWLALCISLVLELLLALLLLLLAIMESIEFFRNKGLPLLLLPLFILLLPALLLSNCGMWSN